MNINWQELFRKLLPHILIFIIFIAATFIYLSPMLQGKTLPQNDIMQWQGSYQETKEFLEETGERTLWTNSMFGGMPTYQIAPWSPNSILGTRYLYNLLVSGWSLPTPANAIFLYCIGFYLLLLALRVNPWIAMFGAMAYAFSSFNIYILEAGHMLQAYALGTGPMVIAAALYTVRWRKYLLGGAFFAVALAIHIATNHPQMSYYTGLVLLIYLIFEFVNLLRQKDFQPVIKSIGMFAIGLILAVASNITFQLTTLEYTKTTIRGPSELTQKEEVASTGLDRDYAFQWSSGIGEAFTILIPDFRGGASGAIGNDNPKALDDVDPQLRQVVAQMDQYWGSQPFVSGAVYFGAIIMFLFVLGLLMINGPLKWWAVTVFIFSVMLSWGHNFMAFNDLMFDYLPLYNKFRSVAFTLVMASMVVPMLAMVTFQKIFDGIIWNDETKRKFYIALGLTAGLALIVYLVPSVAGDFEKPDLPTYGVQSDRTQLQNAQLQPAQIDMVLDGLRQARTSILQEDAGRTLIFILLAAALVFFYFMKKVPQRWLIIGVGVLAVIDLAAVDKRYLGSDAFVRSRGKDAANIPMTAADQAILKDPDPHYRVINIAKNTFNDATTSFYHKSVGGYHGAKLRRFQEMRERYLDQLVSQLNQNLQNNIPPQELLRYLQEARMLSILNMMNTKYIITGQNAQNVVMNPYNLNEAWFVSDINMVPNADAEIAALDSFMPSQTAIIDARYNDYMQGFTPSQSEGTIRMTEYKPNYLVYESSSPAEQFAVFSEVYYNSGLGWEAYIDGKPAEHVRVNFLLRGMRIPAGEHKIEFRFDPQSFQTGETISLIASILLLLLFFGAVFYEVKKNKEEEPKAA